MYGVDINGTTTTVDIGAMTALKRDGSASIPASLVNELKGILFILANTLELFQLRSELHEPTITNLEILQPSPDGPWLSISGTHLLLSTLQAHPSFFT